MPARRGQQVLARDARADGQFVYAVKTTKIFCRPSCPSRRPERKNVTFFPNAEQAVSAGYRACLRCEPESVERRDDPQIAAIDAVSTYLTEHASERTKLKDVAKATGVAPLTILRGFKRVLGVSPREYAKAQRLATFKEKLAKPKVSVTDAIYEAGYGSSSRAYEGTDLGMTPSAMKAGGKGETIRYTVADSPLDRILIGATARGICAIAFGDDDLDLLKDLQKRYPHAELKRMDAELAQEVRAMVALIEEAPAAPQLSIDIRMTAFQQRVWQALRAIPRGATRTYGDIARELGKPQGRAGGGAGDWAKPAGSAGSVPSRGGDGRYDDGLPVGAGAEKSAAGEGSCGVTFDQQSDALLLIDLQPDFMAGGPLAVAGGEEVVPVVNALARRFEHVILTQDWHPLGHISFAATHGMEPYGVVQAAYGAQTLWPVHCVQHTAGAALHAGLEVPHAELILRKGFRRGDR